MSSIRRGTAVQFPQTRNGYVPEIYIKLIRTQPRTSVISLGHLFSANWVIGKLTIPFLLWPLSLSLFFSRFLSFSYFVLSVAVFDYCLSFFQFFSSLIIHYFFPYPVLCSAVIPSAPSLAPRPTFFPQNVYCTHFRQSSVSTTFRLSTAVAVAFFLARNQVTYPIL